MVFLEFNTDILKKFRKHFNNFVSLFVVNKISEEINSDFMKYILENIGKQSNVKVLLGEKK